MPITFNNYRNTKRNDTIFAANYKDNQCNSAYKVFVNRNAKSMHYFLVAPLGDGAHTGTIVKTDQVPMWDVSAWGLTENSFMIYSCNNVTKTVYVLKIMELKCRRSKTHCLKSNPKHTT